jgi:two-component system, LuxR family, response regulator FixJ
MNERPTVFIVDDEAAIRDSLCLLMQSARIDARAFASGGEYLAQFSPSDAGCLILDVRMPDADGLSLQRELAARGSRMPVIILTGHGDVDTAVEAMRAGAMDFVQKPFDSKSLLKTVQEAIELDARTRKERADRATIIERLALLTPRENEVLGLVVDGLSTKAIAARLGSSFNTVQNQRASILKKMRAESVADVVRMVMIARLQ